MIKTDHFAGCPVQHALRFIGGKWQMGILSALKYGPVRFVEINKKLLGLSEKVLTQQLRFFESEGMIRREVVTGVPSKVIYSLTTEGRELVQVVEKVKSWGYNHLREQKFNTDMLTTPLSVIREIESANTKM